MKAKVDGQILPEPHGCHRFHYWQMGGMGLLSVAVVWLIWGSDRPLGIPGEWTWHRSPPAPFYFWLAPLGSSLVYLAYLVFHYQRLHRRDSFGAKHRPVGWWRLLGLLGLAGWMQWHWLHLPIQVQGLARWPIALTHPACSGYLAIGRQIEPAAFLTDYETWIQQQDVFHIGTHPPGLFLVCRCFVGWCRQSPRLTDWLWWSMPTGVESGLLAPDTPTELWSRPERAAVWLLGLTTWGLGLLTTVPLVGVLQYRLRASAVWLAVGIWSILPAWLLFIPIADVAFPFLVMGSCWALTLAWPKPATRAVADQLAEPITPTEWNQLGLALLGGLGAGILWWIGVNCSLAFLAILPILLGPLASHLLESTWQAKCAWCEQPRHTRTWRSWRRFGLRQPALAALLGFAIATWTATGAIWIWFDLNLFQVWQINLGKHAGFYQAMPRSYWPWLMLGLLEFAVVLGPVPVFWSAWLFFQQMRVWRLRPAPNDQSGSPVTPVDFQVERVGKKNEQIPTFSIETSGQAPNPRAEIADPAGLLRLVGWTALTVALLASSGRNRGEVARLWIFLTPLVLVAASTAWSYSRPSTWLFGVSVLFQIIVTLTLLAGVEPLLPIAITAR